MRHNYDYNLYGKAYLVTVDTPAVVTTTSLVAHQATAPTWDIVSGVITETDTTWSGGNFHCKMLGITSGGNPEEYFQISSISTGLDEGTGLYTHSYFVAGDLSGFTISSGDVLKIYQTDIVTPEVTSESEFTTSAVGNPFLHGGVFYDEETKYYYMRARYYDAEMRHFLSRDVLEADILGNLYSAFDNNSGSLTDPMGLASWSDTFTGGLHNNSPESLDVKIKLGYLMARGWRVSGWDATSHTNGVWNFIVKRNSGDRRRNPGLFFNYGQVNNGKKASIKDAVSGVKAVVNQAYAKQKQMDDDERNRWLVRKLSMATADFALDILPVSSHVRDYHVLKNPNESGTTKAITGATFAFSFLKIGKKGSKFWKSIKAAFKNKRSVLTGSERALKDLDVVERAFADEMLDMGFYVHAIERGAGKTADFLINGVKTELKTLTELGENTMKNAIEKAMRQGKNIVIDTRYLDNANGITADYVMQQIMRAQGNKGSLVGRVIVRTAEGVVKH